MVERMSVTGFCAPASDASQAKFPLWAQYYPCKLSTDWESWKIPWQAEGVESGSPEPSRWPLQNLRQARRLQSPSWVLICNFPKPEAACASSFQLMNGFPLLSDISRSAHHPMVPTMFLTNRRHQAVWRPPQTWLVARQPSPGVPHPQQSGLSSQPSSLLLFPSLTMLQTLPPLQTSLPLSGCRGSKGTHLRRASRW